MRRNLKMGMFPAKLELLYLIKGTYKKKVVVVSYAACQHQWGVCHWGIPKSVGGYQLGGIDP
ncbi:MAG: hypothetical protein AAFZ15_22715 [Bacteroidota bacterium]